MQALYLETSRAVFWCIFVISLFLAKCTGSSWDGFYPFVKNDCNYWSTVCLLEQHHSYAGVCVCVCARVYIHMCNTSTHIHTPLSVLPFQIMEQSYSISFFRLYSSKQLICKVAGHRHRYTVYCTCTVIYSIHRVLLLLLLFFVLSRTLSSVRILPGFSFQTQ